MDMWLRVANHHPQIGYVASSQANYYIDRPGSLLSGDAPVHHYVQFIKNQTDYAHEAGKTETFKPLAAWLLKRWMRSMLFDARAADIRRVLRQFKDLFSGPYKFKMVILTQFPGLTAAACRLISKILRTLKLGRKVSLPPRPLQQIPRTDNP